MIFVIDGGHTHLICDNAMIYLQLLGKIEIYSQLNLNSKSAEKM